MKTLYDDIPEYILINSIIEADPSKAVKTIADDPSLTDAANRLAVIMKEDPQILPVLKEAEFISHKIGAHLAREAMYMDGPDGMYDEDWLLDRLDSLFDNCPAFDFTDMGGQCVDCAEDWRDALPWESAD